MKKTNRQVLSPVIAPGSLTPPTIDELRRRERLEARSAELGLIAKFDGEFEHENPYRAEAMLYIIKDMDVPEELKQKIKLEDEAYKRRLQVDNIKK